MTRVLLDAIGRRHTRRARPGSRRASERSRARPPRRALRAPRARVRAPGVPEQDLPRAERRRRCAAAARADARVLRLLRLALLGARPLAARAHRTAVARVAAG